MIERGRKNIQPHSKITVETMISETTEDVYLHSNRRQYQSTRGKFLATALRWKMKTNRACKPFSMTHPNEYAIN